MRIRGSKVTAIKELAIPKVANINPVRNRRHCRPIQDFNDARLKQLSENGVSSLNLKTDLNLEIITFEIHTP